LTERSPWSWEERERLVLHLLVGALFLIVLLETVLLVTRAT